MLETFINFDVRDDILVTTISVIINLIMKGLEIYGQLELMYEATLEKNTMQAIGVIESVTFPTETYFILSGQCLSN